MKKFCLCKQKLFPFENSQDKDFVSLESLYSQHFHKSTAQAFSVC